MKLQHLKKKKKKKKKKMKKTGLPFVVRHGEAASGDKDAAEQHHKKFQKIIEEGGFV